MAFASLAAKLGDNGGGGGMGDGVFGGRGAVPEEMLSDPDCEFFVCARESFKSISWMFGFVSTSSSSPSYGGGEKAIWGGSNGGWARV